MGNYDKYLINCVAGCYYPVDTSDGSTISEIPSYRVGDPPFATGTKLKVDCRGSTSSREIICRADLGWEGLNELNCKKNIVNLLAVSKNKGVNLIFDKSIFLFLIFNVF